jgi:protease PrsW
MILDLILLALVPSALVMILFFFSDRYEKEPLEKLFACILLGSLISVPIGLIHHLFPWLSKIHFASDLGNTVFKSFILAALIEESLKYLVVMRCVYRSPEFNEPFDGMVYYVAVAVGFAVYEDFGYILKFSSGHFFAGHLMGRVHDFYSDSFKIAAIRSFPAHAFFGAVSGYFLARAKFGDQDRRNAWLAGALLIGILCHGVFNSIAFTWPGHALFYLSLYLGTLFVIILFLRHRLLSHSPFNKPRLELSIPELTALLQSRMNAKGNLGMTFVFSLLYLPAILFIFFINVLISGFFR